MQAIFAAHEEMVLGGGGEVETAVVAAVAAHDWGKINRGANKAQREKREGGVSSRLWCSTGPASRCVFNASSLDNSRPHQHTNRGRNETDQEKTW